MSKVITAFITKKALKALSALVEPVDESIDLLKKIDAKLDAQATSRLQGQLRMLQTAGISGKLEMNTLHIALHALSESSEYFKSMARMSSRDYGKQFEGIKDVKVFVGFFSSKALKKPLLLLTEFINYVSLFKLSEYGRLICLTELRYPKSKVKQEYEELLKTKLGEKYTHYGVIEFLHMALIKKRIPEYFPSYFKDFLTSEFKLSQSDRNTYKLFRLDKKLLDRFVYAFILLRNVVDYTPNSKDVSALIDSLSKKKTWYLLEK